MTSLATHSPAAALPRRGPLALLASGREALREVPGLRAFIFRGFLLNYGVFAVCAVLGMGLIYTFVVEPIGAGLSAWSLGEGFLWETLAFLLQIVLWIAQLLLMAGTLLLSFFLALVLMSFWFEALAGRIVAHCRQGAEGPPFSLKAWAATLLRSLRESARLILLAVAALLLGFIPVVGPVLVVLVNAYLLGWEVRNPYLLAREESGDDPAQLRRGLKLWTVRVGLLPVLLAMGPILGWALLPAAMIYLVAGFAWQGERGLQTHDAG